MSMHVTLVSDSTFVFEMNGIRILTDPWIGTTIYGGGWRQFPPPVISAKDVGRLDYIFISHIHEDHCCPQTIAQLDRSATVLLMEKKPNFVGNFLDHHGFQFADVVTLKPREVLRVNPELAFEVVEADPAHELNHMLDSSLLIHHGKETIYFANDNPPYPELYDYLKRYQFSLALVPPSGGSGYPSFYQNLNSTEKQTHAEQILTTYHHTMLDCLQALQPARFACCSPAHVLAGANHKKTYEMSWADNGNAPYKYLKTRMTETDTFAPVLLKPGYTLDLGSSPGHTLDEAIKFYDNKRERDAFIATVAGENAYGHEHLHLPPSVKFERLFELAHERLRGMLERAHLALDWWYQFPFGNGKTATIALHPPYALTFDDAVKPEKRLCMTIDPRMLFLLLTGGFSWNIADAAGFITYDRIPNNYLHQMYINLNHLRI